MLVISSIIKLIVDFMVVAGAEDASFDTKSYVNFVTKVITLFIGVL